MSSNKSLAFVRMEDGQPTTVGLLRLRMAKEDVTDDDALDSLRAAITEWVAGSEEGAAAWEESEQDFNIGDLAHHEMSPTLGRYLECNGIFCLTLDVLDPQSQAIGYDEKLVNEDELPWG